MCDSIRLAVLVSGNGSNLQVFIDAIANGELDAEISLVISDNPDAYALVRAEKSGIVASYVGRKEFASREEYEFKMVEILQEAKVDLILLAGFMRILSPVFISHFPNRMMNIHPSLLPAFPGLDAQGQALTYGAKVTGCTVHFVDEGMDTGPIILQSPVPVVAGDTHEELAKRIQVEEHRTYIEAVRLYRAGCLQVEGRQVMVLPKGGS